MLFADLSLARRLEAAEAWAGAEWVRAHKRLHPESGAIAEPIAGGYAVFAGVNSPLTQAVGLGLDGPVSDAEIDRLESFFRERGDAVRIELCPLADPGFVEQLGRRGYRVAEFSNVLVRKLVDAEWLVPVRPGIVVRRIATSETQLWAQTVARGFGGHFPVTEEMVDMLLTACQVAAGASYLALLGGEPVGGAGLSIHDGLAILAGAATLPPFRNRGVQAALLRARLVDAVETGCDLAMTSTQPGSTSQRNVERSGFRLVYTRAKMVRGWH